MSKGHYSVDGLVHGVSCGTAFNVDVEKFFEKFSKSKFVWEKFSIGGNDVTFNSVVPTFPGKKFYRDPSYSFLNFYGSLKIA
jgi:hypothetical protein